MRIAIFVPSGGDRGPQYMDQALAAIHQANPERLPLTLSFERHGDSVQLICEFPPALSSIVESQLYAQYPNCRLEHLVDELPALPADCTTVTARLHLHRYLFPIRRYTQFEDALNRTIADPLTAILTTVARQRRKGMSASIRITIRPALEKRRVRAERCLRRLTRPFFRSHPMLAHFYVRLALSHSRLLRLAGWLFGRLARSPGHHIETASLETSSTRLHDREEDLQAAADKWGRLLFQVDILLTASGPAGSETYARDKILEMAGAFGQFSSHRLASFKLSRPRVIRKRLRSSHRSAILSSEEVAGLFHPPTGAVRAETMQSVQSRAFEPPVTLPTPALHPDAAILGVTAFRENRKTFGILPEDQRRHIAITGKTGMGKSTLLHHLITSDIHAGRGVCLIDPHGDLCDAVVTGVPSYRNNDVVLFDVGDITHPLAFNVLACADPSQRSLTVDGIVAAFKKIWGEFFGPRMEHILRNTLLTLIEVPGTTLVSVVRMLGDAKYRQGIVDKVSDPVIRNFWTREFAPMPPKLQAEAVAPIYNKVGQFVSNPLLRNILGQARSTLHLRQIMDDGKILLVNLSKGRVGEGGSALLGSFLVSALQLAAMSRADMPEDARRDFYLYVDEFQNYGTDSFATILSEARKYRLNLTVANQYLAQLDEETFSAVIGNIGSMIAFQVGAQDAEVIAQQFGGELQPQDLMTLPRYNAYARLLIKGMPSAPFSMQTLPPATRRGDPRRPEAIRRYSRQRYCRPVAHVEKEIAAAFAA